jgi:hypothetical protein
MESTMLDQHELMVLRLVVNILTSNDSGQPAKIPLPCGPDSLFNPFVDCILWTLMGVSAMFMLTLFIHGIIARLEDAHDTTLTRDEIDAMIDEKSLDFAWKSTILGYSCTGILHWTFALLWGPKINYSADWMDANIDAVQVVFFLGLTWYGIAKIEQLSEGVLQKSVRPVPVRPVEVHVYVPHFRSGDRHSRPQHWTKVATHEYQDDKKLPSWAASWPHEGS